MTSLSLHLPKPNLCLCCTLSPFYNWHSNTSEMKYWHLAPVTLHNNTYCIPHTSLSTAAAGCACVRIWKWRGVKKRKKNETKRRERDMICPSAALSVHLSCWCGSAAVHSTERSITGEFFLSDFEQEEWERVSIRVLQGHPCGSWSTHLVH